jgi:hypothetical protein
MRHCVPAIFVCDRSLFPHSGGITSALGGRSDGGRAPSACHFGLDRSLLPMYDSVTPSQSYRSCQALLVFNHAADFWPCMTTYNHYLEDPQSLQEPDNFQENKIQSFVETNIIIGPGQRTVIFPGRCKLASKSQRYR